MKGNRMSFTEFTQKILRNYFIIVTGIIVVIALLGSSFYPEDSLRYNAFFSPLIYGAVAVLPSFVLYSKKELTFKQMLFRRILHFGLLEMSQLSIAYLVGVMNNFIMVMLFLSVFAVYLFLQIGAQKKSQENK
jgi:Ca2+/Na+ antiporter